MLEIQHTMGEATAFQFIRLAKAVQRELDRFWPDTNPTVCNAGVDDANIRLKWVTGDSAISVEFLEGGEMHLSVDGCMDSEESKQRCRALTRLALACWQKVEPGLPPGE